MYQELKKRRLASLKKCMTPLHFKAENKKYKKGIVKLFPIVL
jgi:hypothetical protein